MKSFRLPVVSVASVASIMLALLCGRSAADAGPYEHAAGWRVGTVESLGVSSALGQRVKLDCRDGASADTLASQIYVGVLYLRGRRPHERIVPLPAQTELKLGDSVFVNTVQCEMAVVRRAATAAP